MFPGRGHAPPLEHLEEFERVAGQFLRREARRSRVDRTNAEMLPQVIAWRIRLALAYLPWTGFLLRGFSRLPVLSSKLS